MFPLRKTFAKPSSDVLTNHFDVTWKDHIRFYVYEVLNLPASKSKRQSKSIIRAAIRAWDFLYSSEQFFVIDNLKMIVVWKDLIVVWKDLHDSISCPRINNADGDIVWAPQPLADGERRMKLGFKFHGQMNLERLKDFVNPAS